MPDRLPTFFIPHGGGPCFFMEWNPPHEWDRMADWLKQLGASLDAKPNAILVISGHWEQPDFTVTSSPHPPLIYDYSGFPPETYQIQYPAPGAPELAHRVADILSRAGLACQTDPRRGFDHGVFIPFKLIYPDADIPMVQLSLKAGLEPAEHLAAGLSLEPLRADGVLIVGSGMSYHNLRAFMSGGTLPDSDMFDRWLTAAASASDPKLRNQQLANWRTAPAARQAHPREEHLMPIMLAAGAAGDDPGHRVFTDRVMGATVSAYRFG